VIHSLAQGQHDDFLFALSYQYDYEFQCGEWVKDVTLDPRWLDAAVKLAELETVMALARPGHKGTIKLLAKTMKAGLKKKTSDVDYELSRVLETMIRINHPDIIKYHLASLKKAGKEKNMRYYYAYWLLRLIPDLPKTAVPKIEALIPSFNEKLIDEIIPYLEQLKAK
jgi:hypothetical protein